MNRWILPTLSARWQFTVTRKRLVAAVGALLAATFGAVTAEAVMVEATAVEAIKKADVAIALRVVGEARVITENGESTMTSLMRLTGGAQVVTEKGSELILVLASGKRYRVGPESRVTIEPTSLSATTGELEILPEVPALVELWPLVIRRGALERAAAARIRSPDDFTPTLGLYPSQGAIVDADCLSLRFEPIDKAHTYAVRVEEASTGQLLWSHESSAHRLSLAPGTLPAGTTLYWEVVALSGDERVASEGAIFHTVPGGVSEPLRALVAQVAADPELAPLLAAIHP